MVGKINILVAILAGALSVLSPCILPVLPSFFGYITGVSLSKPYTKLEKKTLYKKLLFNTVLFALGFSIIFILFGAVIGTVGQFLLHQRNILQQIAGVIIIVFGLQLTGILKLKTFLKEKKFELPEWIKHTEYLRSFVTGICFAFGWSPCYGPIVGTIFTLALSKTDFWQAMLLFTFYSIGFVIPLLMLSILVGIFSVRIKKLSAISHYISIGAGFIVIFLGILLLTNQLNIFTNWLNLFYNNNNFNLL